MKLFVVLAVAVLWPVHHFQRLHFERRNVPNLRSKVKVKRAAEVGVQRPGCSRTVMMLGPLAREPPEPMTKEQFDAARKRIRDSWNGSVTFPKRKR